MDKRKENDLLELKIKLKEQELREVKRERDKFGREPLILIIKSFILAIFLSALLLCCGAWILFIAVLLLFVGGWWYLYIHHTKTRKKINRIKRELHSIKSNRSYSYVKRK